MDAKKIVIDTALKLGFSRAVIASLEPMEAEKIAYEKWLAAGYAGSMEYLKRNPHIRTSPLLLYPQALSAILVFASYYTEPPPSPGNNWGKVAAYAVGLDYHTVLRAKLRELKACLETYFKRPILGKAFTDDVVLLERSLAARSGLGFIGRNSLVIGPKLMGSYHFIAELLTDLPLEPDVPYHGTCGNCVRCMSNCPTKAILNDKTGEHTIDARLCISYLTIENKNEIPLELRPKVGNWVFGCDVCQEICPYNQRPPKTTWQEFHPEAGVGHYLDLLALLQIKSEEEFRYKFGHTPLARPKRRGLLRNALVVLGNQCSEEAMEAIYEFAEDEPDLMLREHAAWALSQYKETKAQRYLGRLSYLEPDNTKSKMLRLTLKV